MGRLLIALALVLSLGLSVIGCSKEPEAPSAGVEGEIESSELQLEGRDAVEAAKEAAKDAAKDEAENAKMKAEADAEAAAMNK